MRLNEFIQTQVVSLGDKVESKVHGPGTIKGITHRYAYGKRLPSQIAVVYDNETEFTTPYLGATPVKVWHTYSETQLLLGLL